ncbi:cyclohexanone monooxygenase [Panacagrimonas perspica]|uniref:Cyclohexanone monooxygenase n=1 Tax=Panacagrimonas perspica TaxID=381431 RepID=A0A4S3K3G2_9GAMM|nr:NAD(P)/FAD-dependent oxidoreductase [Panacagrimonas perspica]TDU31227.1 cyclohexanone monooxygenase [Panacagrimonas perspica]THD02580.1 monooxygenase [Panacagrimonas perspica]
MAATDKSQAHFDIVVVGAGFSGMYMVHRARASGLRVKCFEAGAGVGGTWYWNRYPGARVDIESLEYSYSFSDTLQKEWEWTERYAAQPELLRYANHVADRFDLREDIAFETKVQSAIFNDEALRWVVRTDRGGEVTAQFCIFATGLISAPLDPDFPGLEQYRGEQYRTARWPHEEPQFCGKRVGIIGTGSSGIQVIPKVAEIASHLTVFQRTPAYTVPLRNGPPDPQKLVKVKAEYEGLRKLEFNSFAGFVMVHSNPEPPPTKSALEVSEEERQAEYENRWASGGLCLYYTYSDVLMSDAANQTLSDFVRAKMKARVKDPEIAEKLTPYEYPILTKRLSAETDYCETFNRDNVRLVDVRSTPIETFTETGIRVDGELIELDAVIFATGFDVMTGAMDRIDIRGRKGLTLKQRWSSGHTSYLGMMTHGFPNMIWMNGPGSQFFNPILQAEFQGDWIDKVIKSLKERGKTCFEATEESEDAWIRLNDDIANMTLFPKSKNYYMGDNIPGKARRILFYFGGFPSYRSACETAARDLDSFNLSGELKTVTA